MYGIQLINNIQATDGKRVYMYENVQRVCVTITSNKGK